MSRKVATLVYSKQVGSMARKAVLAYFADRANDDGSGIWTAKQRVADEIECSKQTVITTVKALLADGLITVSGKRPNGNGYTVEYAIDLAVVAALPDSKREEEGVQNWTGQELDGSTPLTPRGQAALPKPSLNRPIPQKATPSSGKRANKFTLPPDIPADEWRDFEEMRRVTRKPMTDSIRNKCVARLRKLAEHGFPPGEVLSHSTLNNYQGLFPPKDDQNGRPTTNGMAGHRGHSASGHGSTVDAAQRFLARHSA